MKDNKRYERKNSRLCRFFLRYRERKGGREKKRFKIKNKK